VTGPYTAEVKLENGETLSLTWEDDRELLEEGENIAFKFYRSGGGATLTGTLRAAVFAVGKLLEAGEEASIDIIGRQPSTGDERLRRGGANVRRNEHGVLVTTLGSRWSRERAFIGA